MKSIRTEPLNHAAEGDERIRTAVTAPSTDPAYESDEDFLARLERLGRDYRYSDEFIGTIVRNRFPRGWPWEGDEVRRAGDDLADDGNRSAAW